MLQQTDLLFNMKVTTSIVTLLGCLIFSSTAEQLDYAVNEYELTSSTTEFAPPPHPYVFSYTAGRYPGHADRTHSEVSDGSGVVRGSFSYIDPRQQIRTVDYTADQNGFHPVLSHLPQPPQESAAVKLATQRHLALYNRIAESHANPQVAPQNAELPNDTASVAYAKQKHFTLFEKIAEDHARIAAERKQEQLAFEATSEISEYQPI